MPGITDALRNPTTGQVTVPAHSFGGGLQLWAEGLITKTQFINGAKIPADAIPDIDAMAAVYQSKAVGAPRLAYVVRAEKCAILLQTDAITPANFRTFMEIP